MTVLTLNLALPSEFVSDAATAGTADDWLVIQKSGQSQLRRLPASVTALGGALENGSLTEDFSASLFYLPESGSLWATTTSPNTTGLTISGTNNTLTAWCERLRVMNDLSSQDYSEVRCGALEIRNTSEAVTATISGAGAIAGVSVAATGAVTGATLTLTGAASCVGLSTGSGAATVKSIQFTDDTGSGLTCGTDGIIEFTSNANLCAQANTTTFYTKTLLPMATITYACGTSSNSWSNVHCVSVTQTSDARLKTDIADSDLGLDFILSLRPVKYRWIVGGNTVTAAEKAGDAPLITSRPGVRTHYGLLAQEVKSAVGASDFGGHVVDAETGEHALRYSQFVAPIIKALQEEHAARLALEARVANILDILSKLQMF